jgi:signal transduction histidine kinase
MSERATLIGATLAIDTDPDAGGCRVRLDVPLEEQR